ncbi:hypothetical protein J3A83DRAFT_4366918 [Scleroderma citrinum]
MSKSNATSPSIPTPSLMTVSPPPSNSGQNEAFEVLIDLLASDGADDVPLTGSVPRTKSTLNTALRDPSGRLDFAKIRSMFEAQNQTHAQSPSDKVPNSDVGDVELAPDWLSDENTGHVQQSHPVLVQPSPDPTSSFAQGLQPEENRQPAVAPLDDTTPRDVLSTAFSFNKLNDALESAHDQVRTLRKQYDELQAFVSEKFGKGKLRKRVGQKAAEKTGYKECIRPIGVFGDEPGPSRLKGQAAPPLVDIAAEPHIAHGATSDGNLERKPSDSIIAEVAQLSEEEAKRVLTIIARTLSIRPSRLCKKEEMPEIDVTLSQASQAARCDLNLEEIPRALDFVQYIDEMIWRRTSFPMDPPLAPIFSSDNIEALRARLELWEKIIRRTGI